MLRVSTMNARMLVKLDDENSTARPLHGQPDAAHWEVPPAGPRTLRMGMMLASSCARNVVAMAIHAKVRNASWP